MAEPSAKRRRADDLTIAADLPVYQRDTPSSLTEPISPPRKRVRPRTTTPLMISSPFHLTKIRDLPESNNIDCVSLHDILGDPLISECWEFNFLHDIDFLMQHFDEDTRSLVKVHIVHGFWKKEDESRIVLERQKREYSNVDIHVAYMPEMFGTHHSKMMVLFRHDVTGRRQ